MANSQILIHCITPTRDFLHTHRLQVGAPVTVLSLTDSDERLLGVGDNTTPDRHICITQPVAARILVVPREDLLEASDMVCNPPNEIAPHVKLIPLSQLRKGETGVIVRPNSRGPLRQRLLDMGVVTGAEIRLKHKAPLGDPLEFTVKDYQISLRKEEAAEIIVEVALCL